MANANQHYSVSAAPAPLLTICPNTVLGLLVLNSLVFVSYFGQRGVLVFIAAGLFLLVRRAEKTRDEFRAFWWIYLLPAWCIFSLIWSDHPFLSLRHGTQLVVTFLITVTLANRLSPVVFLRILFLSLAVAGAASLLFGNVRDDGIWVGVFQSKNYYAFTMVALVLCSFAMLADRTEPTAWRIAGCFGLVMGLPQIKMAESMGAAIATVFVISMTLTILFTHALHPARRARALALFCGIALVIFLTSLYFQDAILALVVEQTGKDPSLTGRTLLWSSALGEIARSPLLGTGYRAFWVEGNPLAEQIWAEFYIASKSGFNFHNLFLSNAVEIGLIGVLLLGALLVPALILCTRWLLQSRRAPAMFCFMAIAFVMVLSMVEVPVFFEFDALTVMALGALVYGVRVAREVPHFRPQARAAQV